MRFNLLLSAGGGSRQAVQSVGVHLARLCLFLENGLSAEEANAAMLRVGRFKANMVQLQPPGYLGSITVADVLAAQGDEQHAEVVRRWALCAWRASLNPTRYGCRRLAASGHDGNGPYAASRRLLQRAARLHR
ncbi:MAG TPA: DUF5946 family protein [Xanthomonadaceae bacterium]|nr:DUF5946 family protein [Xanthomonadaceae bacterium]